MTIVVNPKIDLIFKKLFGSEENKDILMSLINSILPDYQQIVEITLKNPYNVSDYAEGKLSILDIKAEDAHGVLYDIEMQIKGTVFYGRRTLYYWAKMFGSQLDSQKEEDIEEEEKKRKKLKDAYSELKKCIVISLMDFEFFKDEKYHRCYMLKDRENNQTHKDLDYLDLYFVELEKFEEGLKPIQTILERWITFLNNASRYTKSNLPPELSEIKEIRKASSKLEIMYLDKKERQYYEAQQKFWLDQNSMIREMQDKIQELESIQQKVEQEKQQMELVNQQMELVNQQMELALQKTEQAKQQAEQAKQQAEQALSASKEKRNLEIVKNAIKKGFDNATIADLTGLTVLEIQEIRINQL
ncbi:MAG: Rpn family recombination-promoting nuclease/putative transposase [Bacteroidetes bacterium]|nr:MAG: Rpn family recombination-promoting nuclease/putative transposase [Bacteroidota bacterium]